MLLRPDYRDIFPKLDLHGGYIGDGYPLCSSLPARLFLRPGARYTYLGPTLTTDMTRSFEGEGLPLLDASSSLFSELCWGNSGGVGRCTLRSEVTLTAELACSGVECEVDLTTVRLLKLVNGNRTAFFEWLRPACVEMAVYSDAKRISMSNDEDRDMCADPRTPAAGARLAAGLKMAGPPRGSWPCLKPRAARMNAGHF